MTSINLKAFYNLLGWNIFNRRQNYKFFKRAFINKNNFKQIDINYSGTISAYCVCMIKYLQKNQPCKLHDTITTPCMMKDLLYFSTH